MVVALMSYGYINCKYDRESVFQITIVIEEDPGRGIYHIIITNLATVFSTSLASQYTNKQGAGPLKSLVQLSHWSTYGSGKTGPILEESLYNNTGYIIFMSLKKLASEHHWKHFSEMILMMALYFNETP